MVFRITLCTQKFLYSFPLRHWHNSRLHPFPQHWLPTNFLFMYPLSWPNIVINWYYINFYLYLFALALRWRRSPCWTPTTSACSTLPPFPTCTGPSSGTTALFTRHSKKLVGMDSAPQVWVRIWILKFIIAKVLDADPLWSANVVVKSCDFFLLILACGRMQIFF